tara:strand:- start:24577 stop:25404 length:828 start_codon:yes stop_codon:yes gene_type:complete
MRYQFQSNPSQFSYKPSIFTDAIKILVSINFGIFVLQTISGAESLFFPLFGLVPKLVWSQFMLWQPFTYLFFHGGVWHVLINMFVLWMFGSELERLWGKVHFLRFYFITGIGAGLLTMLFGLDSITPIVGASGAVYGILLAYGLTYPNRTIYLYGIIPIKSLWFIIGIGTIAFISSFDGGSQISHLTHLSGMVIGYFVLKKPVRLNDLWFSIRKRTMEYKVQQQEKKFSEQQAIELDIDRILDKIHREGFDSLSEEENDRLYKGSQSISRSRKKD